MKQKILIPDGAYDLISTYVPITAPLLNNTYISRGYTVTPNDKKLIKTLFADGDKVVVFTINPKKDPRRNKSTKTGNPLLFSFADLLEDQRINCDLIINMSPLSETSIDLIFNQFITPIDKDNNKNLEFTLNGNLGTLRIDRTNPFKRITINGNNTTDFYKAWHANYHREAKINILDNTIEELNFTCSTNVDKGEQQSIYLNTLQSYSLKKIKIGCQFVKFNSSLRNWKLLNLKEIDLENAQIIDLYYNQFINVLRDCSKPFNYFNKDCKIKLNPQTKLMTGHSVSEKMSTLKETWNLEFNEPFEITVGELVSILRNEKKIKDILNNKNKNIAR